MKRTIEQWRKCDPTAMATQQSENARMFAYQDARTDILELDNINKVLLRLLNKCADVLRTVDIDDSDEMTLMQELLAAIDGLQAPEHDPQQQLMFSGSTNHE